MTTKVKSAENPSSPTLITARSSVIPGHLWTVIALASWRGYCVRLHLIPAELFQTWWLARWRRAEYHHGRGMALHGPVYAGTEIMMTLGTSFPTIASSARLMECISLIVPFIPFVPFVRPYAVRRLLRRRPICE